MQNKIFEVLIIDVDGVMTDGRFYYNEDGKFAKVFGADDHEALKYIKRNLEILFVSADKKGFEISKKRIVNDMGFTLSLVDSFDRISWIKERYDPCKVIYIGDGLLDHFTMKEVGYSIAPPNALDITKKSANFITTRVGGDRCVAEAVLHIADKLFNKNILLDY